MIFKYFITHMKILYTDKFTVLITLLSMVLFFLFVSSMSELIMANEVVIAIDSQSDSTLTQKVHTKLNSDSQVRVIRTGMVEGMAMIERGQVDLFITLDEEIDSKISNGDYENLVHFYSAGVSLYSVFYPEMIFGTIVEDIHLSVVERYMAALIEEEGTLLEDGKEVRAKEIYREVFESREDDYFFNVEFLQNDFMDEMKDVTAQKLFYLRRIVGVLFMLLNLYIMVIMVKSVEEYEFGVTSRVGISPVGHWPILAGQWLVGFIPSVAISMVSAFMLVSYKASIISALKIFREMLVVSAILVVVMMIIAHLVKETHKYVLISVLLILAFSISSSIFFEIEILPGGEALKALSPYSYAIDSIVRILTNAGKVL